MIGILPGALAQEANPWVDIVIPSNLGLGRNVLVVATADAIVAVGGGSGTLSEMAMAWQLGRPVVGLELAGWSGRLAGKPIDDCRTDVVWRARDAEEAVECVRRALSTRTPPRGGEP